MRLKPFLPLVLLVFSTIHANAQELYQYTKNSVIQTSSGPISIIRAGGAYIHYAKAEPAYERFESSTSTDPTITRNDDGLWEIDYSKFAKPAQSVVCSMIRASWTQYMSMLKASCKDNDQVWITVRTDSKGKFKNADVKIWAEPSVYRQIPPTVLCDLLNRIDDLQFGIPPEYQCISDHYFRYSVFFKDL